MAVASKRRRGKSKPTDKKRLPYHAFWSGALSFGLVNVPVLVFPASRHSGIRLRMISPDGNFLERRFYCPRDGQDVGSDEIVRGYEVEDGSYVVVTDDELEAAEPQKTQEIQLKEFVELSEVSPAYMERGYFLTPGKGAARAYRLLADVMEETGRAGVATFVMRDREYLVIIFAQHGILCAETLRFHDEIRDPQDMGLLTAVKPTRQRISVFERAISALGSETLSPDLLVDKTSDKLRAIISRKKERGTDIIHMNDHKPEVASREEDEDDVDLLATIRRSLRHVNQRDLKRSRAEKSSAESSRGRLAATRKKQAPRRARARRKK